MKTAREAHTFEKDANEWYLEPKWVNTAFFRIAGLQGCVFDPFAGTGRVLCAAEEIGLETLGAEVMVAGWRPKFCRGPSDTVGTA
jgi:hypothetical protein